MGIWGAFGLPFFLCPKWSFFGSGVTGGVTNWGYIFKKVGLQKWGKTHNNSLGRKTTTFTTLCAGKYVFFISD